VKNNDRNPNGSHVGGTTRRDFLRKSTYAAAGLVATGFFQRNATAKEAKQKAAKGAKLELISPTFETSPTYLATYPASERAKKIMKEATVIDTLFSAVYPLQWKNDDQFHPVMDECMAAGMNVLGYCTSADVASPDPAAVLNGLKFPLRKIAERPHKYMIVRTGNDIREAKKQGKLGFYFVHQGTNQYGGDVDNVALMRQLGFGYCLLVYNNKNAVGGGCADDEDVGLTAYGRKLIQAYNRYGMVVDVTHTGNRTALDACAASSQPVIASHSGAKGVFPAFRNLSDELIKAIAGTGGVCSVFFTGGYIDPTNPPAVGPEIIFKHMDYMVQLVGNTNHVGFGSDWIPDMNKTMELILSKADAYPDKGLPPGTTKKAISMYGPTANPARVLPAVVDQMLEHGYSGKDCAKILGGNNLRVFDQVWGGSADVAISDQPVFHQDWR
jgi:membrane dipeptidase